jgi:hypothetical protein
MEMILTDFEQLQAFLDGEDLTPDEQGTLVGCIIADMIGVLAELKRREAAGDTEAASIRKGALTALSTMGAERLARGMALQ